MVEEYDSESKLMAETESLVLKIRNSVNEKLSKRERMQQDRRIVGVGGKRETV